MASVYSKRTKKCKGMINTELDSETQVPCVKESIQRASTLLIFYSLSWVEDTKVFIIVFFKPLYIPEIFHIFKIIDSYNPAISLWETPTVCTRRHVRVSIEACNHEKLQTPKCSLSREWINELWHRHTIKTISS